jgi:acetate kinase
MTRAAVLAVNAGSSSLKFALHPVDGDAVALPVLSGLVEGLEPSGQPRIRITDAQGEGAVHAVPMAGFADAGDAALHAVVRAVQGCPGHQLLAVAHRVVHGGPRHAESVRLDDAVLAELEALAPLAPLHQPFNLAGVRAFARHFPGVPQVACFDTAFHAHAPEVEQRFALPDEHWRAGVRRYGFHGLSYTWIVRQLRQRSARAGGRLLLAHLGNGASLCAVREGRGVGSTMGFSAVDGLMMGTRCGSIDAGVLLHLLRQGMDVDALEKLLYKRSGLLGVSGLSADMRTLRASAAPEAQRAIALFTHRIVRDSGALVATLGGLDLIAFAGGIGEHDVQLRHDVAERLAFLGVRLDEAANRRAVGSEALPIHAADSAVEVWVVPTDEGRVAAADALRLVGPRAVPAPAPATAGRAGSERATA